MTDRPLQDQPSEGESSPFLDSHIWSMMIDVPGVGVSLMDCGGRLLFLNDIAKQILFKTTEVDYSGKTLADFQPPEFVDEQLELIKHVMNTGRPTRFRHFYHGRFLESKLWPIQEKDPGKNRILVVTRELAGITRDENSKSSIHDSEFIDLGELGILSQRELEVLVLLGHGMSVPEVARTLHRSRKTIERHKASIAAKLSLKGQAEMARLVAMVGLEWKHAKLRRLSEDR